MLIFLFNFRTDAKFIAQHADYLSLSKYERASARSLFCETEDKFPPPSSRARMRVHRFLVHSGIVYEHHSVILYRYPRLPLLSIAPTSPEISVVIGKWTRRVRIEKLSTSAYFLGLFSTLNHPLSSEFIKMRYCN